MRIAVIGLGYVGCVAVGKLCAAGHNVIGVDLDEVKVRLVNDGKPTVIEPGLDELFTAAKKQGNLRAVSGLKEVAHEVDIFYLCVGTPLKSSGELDLKAVFHVADEIAAVSKNEKRQKALIVRSTVKPGTCLALSQILKGCNISVVMNPEFLREGTAVDDWDAPGLVVIGASDDFGRDMTEKLHASVKGHIFQVKPETAEVIKYVNNSWHALKVAFANEVGRLSHGYNVDHEELISVFLADKKLNLSGYYLKPGMPYGGSCLTKDLSALTVFAREHGLSVPVLSAVKESNESHIAHIVNIIRNYGKTRVGIFGLSFKKGTDDLRYSPSIMIIKSLWEAGMTVKIFDENVHFEKLKGQNKEQVLDILPLLKGSLMNSFDMMMGQVDLVVVTHDIGEHMDAMKRSYPNKIFLEAFRLKA